ncbi:MAG TPA: creatininase family protein [Amnibacterium sp.]|jgi:creatinine amidohydrolase
MLVAATATAPQVATHLAAGRGVAILPFGALEQHGPHLPLATDTITAEAVAAALADRLDALLLPAVPFGDTWNMSGYPGTVSLRPETVTAIAEDVGRGVAASGARLLVVVNGDWGNRAPLAVAARRLADVLPTVVLDHPGLDAAIDRVRESRPAAAGLAHAEEVETSLLLHLAPHLVGDERPAEYPDFPSDFGVRPMRMHPFSASGVFGDAGPATAAKGAALLDAVADESMRVLADLLP